MAQPACVIGKDIQVRGKLSGSGGLVVEGRVEGTIELEDTVTIEESGELVADVEAKEITVHGKISGNLDASDCASVLSSATVQGDIRANRIIIEAGARFRGNIEMDVPLPKDI